MEWQQGVRVMLEKSDGLAIATSSRGLFREGPDQHFRIHVQFEDDFDLKGASVVKVVLVIGYETQLPGSLEDLQCYAIDKAHLIGAHTFDSLVTWKGGSRPVHTPLTIPVPGRRKSRPLLHLDTMLTSDCSTSRERTVARRFQYRERRYCGLCRSGSLPRS